jgi:hypothetical protein
MVFGRNCLANGRLYKGDVRRGGVAFVIVAMGLVGCHHDRAAVPKPTPSTLAPTTVTTPAMTATTAVGALPPGPPCLTANLQGHYEDYISAMTQPSYFFTLVNNGSRCTLNGYPGVQVVSSTGQMAGTTAEHKAGFVTRDPGPSPVTLATGAKAWFAISSTGMCDRGTTTAPASSAVLLTPPGNHQRIKVPAVIAYCPHGAVGVSAVATDRDALMFH